MNPALFKRVKALYDNREKAGYNKAQMRAVEQSYKSFVRNGALLSDAQKNELKTINGKLSDLYLKFNKNLLNATNAFDITVDDKA